MNEAPAVSLIECRRYESDVVFPAVKAAVDLVGGMGRFVKPGQKALLKVNLTSTRNPVSCTHPLVVEAVARLAVGCGAEVVIADSIPEHAGGLWQKAWPQFKERLKGLDYDQVDWFFQRLRNLEDPHELLRLVPPGAPGPVFTAEHLGSDEMARMHFARVGYHEAAAAAGASLVALDQRGRREHPNPAGTFLKNILLTERLDWADVVINLPRLKTHNLMRYTGAVKNCFGLVPGERRPRYHHIGLTLGRMEEVFVDIYGVVRPALTVMDGVIGMEGDGPLDGTARAIGVVAASADGVALDAVCGHLINMEPDTVPTTRLAASRGLGNADLKAIQVLGARLADFRVPDFQPPPSVPPEKRKRRS